MGCDIHMSIEVRDQDLWTKDWQTYAFDIPDCRFYSIFEAMAGVRGDEENAIVPPRGVPHDVSRVVKTWIDSWDIDGHTHSWLYPNEFSKVLKYVKKLLIKENYAEPLPREWIAADKVLHTLEKVYGKDNVRIVFFFDN